VKRIVLTLLLAVLAGCSSTTSPSTNAPGTSTGTSPVTSAATPVRVQAPGKPVALVTAETEHAVLEVSATTGRVLRRVHVEGDPTTLAAGPAGPVVVCSPAAGVVTLLSWPALRPTAVLHAFHSPQIAAVTPDGEWALVSDSAGTVSTINLTTRRIADRIEVGSGAHHMAVSPNQRTAWVALGETATTIVRLDASDPRHLRVAGLLHPRLAAHDLAFAPNGRTVWVSSATAPEVSVFDASTGRPIATVPAGAAPQHVVFSHTTPARAYIASGYGRSLELVDPATRHVLYRAPLPYGSFNLATLGPLVATTSLLDGRVTIDNAATLRPRLSATVAPEAREIVLLRRR
jgi:YVTN family beta-propeller protein